ncbi:hypothetical protein ACH5RR_025923 [Cinchona calisaya]|uniref:FYVE-type domain-containing protein n=1 Tax=Cinchona calisaya TaxID=153742 RepID=A0ABD2Z2Z4_9GENT
MTNSQRNSLGERNIDQAITALKRGSCLLKYGRRGKPKLCPFQLSTDETTLIWHVGKEEKQLKLNHVSRIIPGQRTAIFQRFPRPEKEYQSFSLIYGKRSLDLICKDKDEAEMWFVALQALISQGNCQRWKSEVKSDNASSSISSSASERISQSIVSSGSGDTAYEDSRQMHRSLESLERPPQKRLGRAFSDFLLYHSAECSPQRDSFTNSISSMSCINMDDIRGQSSADNSRISSSSALSSCSQRSFLDDFDSLCDLFIWGEGTGDGLLGGGVLKIGELSGAKTDAFLPKALESTMVLDIQNIACGSRHAVLITNRGEVFTWGDGSGGKLGHGIEADIANPKLVDTLSGLSIKSVACGEYHTCAVTVAGGLYTWGDGTHKLGLLGHGNEVSHWTPKKVNGQIEGLHISSVSCGPWHTAAITSFGQLFTFGDGSFGALGHGDCSSTCVPREVEALKGVRTLRVSCGFWHTAAVVDVSPEPTSLDSSPNGKLFTWGNGDEGQLGHGDKAPRLVPSCITALEETSFRKVVCGQSITVALTNSGGIYTMGRPDYGQLGSPGSTGWLPACVQGKIKNIVIEEITCGSFHVAALSSTSEVYTWGKGKNGQLGHGDCNDRDTPTLVEALRSKQVKALVCGNNFTAAICLHKRMSLADHSSCSGCNCPFNFKRKCHNCYNCGLAFCRACSNKKSLKASLAPALNKPYRVCDGCFEKLKKGSDTGGSFLPPKALSGNKDRISIEVKEKESFDTKPHGLVYRLSTFDSFRSSDVGNSRKNQKPNLISGHATIGESFRCDRSYILTPSNSMLDYPEKVSISVPGSMVHSQPVSPLSRGSSPFHPAFFMSSASLSIPKAVLDNSKQKTDDLTKELLFLREQVEILTRRSDFLASQLERTSCQIKNATELARYESEKNNAAKEVIKSLMRQLKEMAARVPPVASFCRTSDPFSENNSNSLSVSSSWSQLTS